MSTHRECRNRGMVRGKVLSTCDARLGTELQSNCRQFTAVHQQRSWNALSYLVTFHVRWHCRTHLIIVRRQQYLGEQIGLDADSMHNYGAHVEEHALKPPSSLTQRTVSMPHLLLRSVLVQTAQ